jgi:hypothetical protein
MKIKAKLKPIIVVLALVCGLALWLRLPGISAGLPYMYWEDETHHFNRTVEMVKSGTYNPNYFHKPSLHFYLRMPVVALSFIWSAKKGYIQSIKEVETRNSFGLAGYNFTASHPGIVKWNRAFSVLMSIGVIVLAALICLELTSSVPAAFFAALFTAISPELLRHSPIIGVDVLMTLMCVLAVWLALRTEKNFSNFKLVLCGIAAGLAVSSKYNAAPIAILPLVVCWATSNLRVSNLALALTVPVVAFFAASPFILVSIPLFLDHLAYEIWHYGVAGHAGQMAEPGLPQAMFYASWLVRDGVGWTAASAAVVGLGLLAQQDKKRLAVFMAFPLLFAALMIGQKTNFTRNVLVIIPIVASLAGAGLMLLLQRIKADNLVKLGLLFFAIPLLVLQPLIGALTYRKSLLNIRESRVQAEAYLTENSAALIPAAVSGELQFTSALYRQIGFERTDLLKAKGLDLFQQGFTAIIAGPEFYSTSANELYSAKLKFSGADEIQRIVANPEIRIFELRPDAKAKLISQLQISKPSASIEFRADGKAICPLIQSAGEEYCWAQQRLAPINMLPVNMPRTPSIKLHLEAMSPWAEQEVSLIIGDKEIVLEETAGAVGEWKTWSAVISQSILKENPLVFLSLTKVRAPREYGLNSDGRHLGLALRAVRWEAVK